MSSMRFDRRLFLQQSVVGSSAVALATGGPYGWLHALAREASQQDRILVVIQLSGGNDGLNTVVPFRDEAYYRARPKLAIAADSVVKLDDSLGLHSAARALDGALGDGRFSIIQGVGYAQPNRSHFESMDIWHTAQRKNERSGQGWLGHWLSSQNGAGTGDSLGLHLGHEQQPLALAGRNVTVPSIASLEQFRLKLGDREALKNEVLQLAKASSLNSPTSNSPTSSSTLDVAAPSDLLQFVQSSTQTALEASQRLEAATHKEQDRSEFPNSQLGEKLHVISQLIVSELPTRVYYVTLDGFDTHARQPAAHEALLRQWAEALRAFLKQLGQQGHQDRVLVMTFSEFGRRVAENASEGTDHGAAAPLFLAGPKMKSSLIGAHPSLTDLEDGDLKYHTDFRCVYATIIQRWFGNASENILEATYPPLDVLV